MSLSVCLKLLLVMSALIGAPVWAQAGHPFGVPEQSTVLAAPEALQGFFGYVSFWQSQFYRQLTDAVRQWQTQGGWGGLLVGLSFAYGVFHALGPGHGKAVIASYVLANRQTARNGAILALAASTVQALVAIAVVSVLAVVFNVTSAVMNEATRWLEACAYAMVVLLGLTLVWRKAVRPLVRAWHARAQVKAGFLGHDVDQGPVHDHDHRNGNGNGHGHGPDHRHVDDERDGEDHGHFDGGHAAHSHHPSHMDHSHRHDHDHAHDDCCGHAHVPAPETMEGPLSVRRAWVAILAIGLRPCSGALIVLVFALAQDFYLAGIVSALAMGAGTGLTVALLAVLSAWAGMATTRLGGLLSSRAAIWVRYAIESVAALMVLALGVLLLGAALVGGGAAG